MRCIETGCFRPGRDDLDGFCGPCWKLNYEVQDPTAELSGPPAKPPKPIDTPAPKIEPLRSNNLPDSVENIAKAAPKKPTLPPHQRPPSTWGWLIDRLKDRDELTIRCSEHGLTAGKKDANRIRSILNQNVATSQWRWSVTQDFSDNSDGDTLTIKRMGGWDIQPDKDGHPEVVKTPLATRKPDSPAQKTPPINIPVRRRPGARDIQAELEALIKKLETERDAAAERVGQLQQDIEAVQICMRLL